MDKTRLKSNALRIAGLVIALAILVPIIIYGVNDFFNLRYISKRVGSELTWESAHSTYTALFEVGMTRDEVHAILSDVDPSFTRNPSIDPFPCSEAESTCGEIIMPFYDRVGRDFGYIFSYTNTPEMELVDIDLAS